MYDCLLPALPWLCRLHRYLVVMTERATSRAHLKFSPDKTMTTNWLTRYTLTHRFHGRQQKKMRKKKIRALFDWNLKSENSACKKIKEYEQNMQRPQTERPTSDYYNWSWGKRFSADFKEIQNNHCELQE